MKTKIHILKSFFNHKIKAKGRHSIHSPFLFNMYESCVYRREKSVHHKTIEKLRKSLLNDDSLVSVNDLGAGSRVNNKSQRKISQIAKHSLKSTKEAQFLSCFAKRINAKNIIELGSSLGLTTARIALDNPNTKIHSIEGSNSIAEIAIDNLKILNIRNATIYKGNFDDIFPNLIQQYNTDLVFIDGNHTKDATLKYFEIAIKHIDTRGFIIFDDIYWSEGMTQAWNIIKTSKEVSLSIDLFHFGIISINPDFSKQHFVLKF